MTKNLINEKRISAAEIALIITLASVSLFVSFPYRVNIFLSWEGAYRMSQGQLPFRDFGIPMGGMYWTIPAVFFKIFGAKLITLIKAQVFINIVSGLAFRSILKTCKVHPGIRFLSLLVFCISYSFFNFWPWYNHTVIVYEFVGLAFLLKYIFLERHHLGWLLLASLFVCFSFLTKQDGGGMALMISLVLLGYYGWSERKWLPITLFTGAFVVFLFAIIGPFLKYNFGYWFNHGQPPHTARISIREIADEFFIASQWIKFYIFIILVILLTRYRNWKDFFQRKEQIVLFLLTICILGEAAVIQVTSYTPPDNNVFFHSFAIAYILTMLSEGSFVNYYKPKTILTALVGIMVWWSSIYWNYIQRIVDRGIRKPEAIVSKTGENIVNKRTYMLGHDTTEIPMSRWKFSGLRVFDKIYMPGATADGIHRLLTMDLVKNKKDLQVLNMSELTPLAAELPFKLETGPDIPLWFHLGVGMFNKQARMFEEKIARKQYDLVLFEYIPNLNNFYPFRVRDSLQLHYQKIDSFPAPRRGNTNGTIEIYTPSR